MWLVTAARRGSASPCATVWSPVCPAAPAQGLRVGTGMRIDACIDAEPCDGISTACLAHSGPQVRVGRTGERPRSRSWLVSPGWITNPFRPSVTASRRPPTSVTTTGRPPAIASRMAVVIPSERGTAARQTTSIPASWRSTSSRSPTKSTSRPSMRPPAAIWLRTRAEYSECVRYSAPTNTSREPGCWERAVAKALDQVADPLLRIDVGDAANDLIRWKPRPTRPGFRP